MKILITGSSGLIGSALTEFLQKGQHDVYKLVRTRADLSPKEIAWDEHHGAVNPELLEGFDAVINLAGESIMGIWTEDKKRKIRNSRVVYTKLLAEALSRLNSPPAVFVSGSAIGYYGNRGDEVLTELSSKGEGFLSDVCAEWENATAAASKRGIRTINLRTGLVLSKKGGALKLMLPAFKLGAGGRLGSGLQYMSWISIDDLVGAIYYAICQPKLSGPLNAVSPQPVTNEEFTKILGKVLNRPTFLPMPTFMVKLVLGQMGEELLLSSERVAPLKLEESGFHFQHANLESALKKET